MKILALLVDTFREIYAKKVILAIIIVEVVALVITGLILFSDGMQHQYSGTAELNFPAGADSAAAPAVNGTAGTAPSRPDESRVDDSRLPGSRGADSLAIDSLAAIDSALLGDSGAADSILANLPMNGADTAGLADDTIVQAPRGGSRTLGNPTQGTVGTAQLRKAGDVMREEMVGAQLTVYGTAIFAATLFLGIFATAGIVPSMMEKGTIDLLLSKPLSRTSLLLGRALGGTVAILANLIFFAGAIWVLYGTASGVWHTHFLTSTIGISLFAYLVLYCGVLLMNVMSESWVLPLTIAYAHITILSPLLTTRESVIYTMVDSPVIRALIDGLYYMLPQTSTFVQDVLPYAILRGSIVTWEPFVQGAIFAAVTLTLALFRFRRKDF